ncbi:MAG TPA: heme-dependent oxidative N-demethylase subunit alpha family protein [Chitinophagaceae bacterium]|nr:heme-dependent oxidative N-demethylase subunit alpha family protein [Chitinophagaceae bacterium]
MKYLPFLDGKYSTAPALTAMVKAEQDADKLVFQADDEYNAFMANKALCRKEDIHKYYVQENLYEGTAVKINKQIVKQLITEYPSHFIYTPHESGHTLYNAKKAQTLQWADDWIAVQTDGYLTLFDALCSQVQEDVAICQLDGDKDWLAAIHLCCPNHWAPADKIGKPFSHVHAIVPGMEKLNSNYFKMLQTGVQKGPFFRFAWGISTDTRLNHHPVAPPGIDQVYWWGRRVEEDTSDIYLRVERQSITGLPANNCFLFTIRTYFYNIDTLSAEEKKALFHAVEGMSPESLEYKGLTDKVEILRRRLLS